MNIRYAYECQGRIVHRGEETTGHQTVRAFAEALADVPKRPRVDHILVWAPGNDTNQPDVRVPQRAQCGV